MSLIGNILRKIIPSWKAATTTPENTAATTPSANAPLPETASDATPPGSGSQTELAIGAPLIDIDAILTAAAAKHSERLDWQRSIVDLLKVIDEDSSFTARKQLAKELHYTGDPADSATMNQWLHRQVMTKLSENGGTLSKELTQ